MQNQSEILSHKQPLEGGCHTPAPAQRSRVCDVPPAFDSGNGGQTTMSPPVNVNSEDSLVIRSLASGIDTLYLTLNVDWGSSSFLNQLKQLKEEAIRQDKAMPCQIEDWLFLVQPFGRRGYEWLIESQEYTLRIGNWVEPKKTKPSVTVEIRSETLWRLGPERAVHLIVSLLKIASESDLTGSRVKDVKVSRVDLCVDVLTPEAFWTMEVMDYVVCRAKDFRPYLKNGSLIFFTGIRIGSGVLFARLYDKPLEIKVKSDKLWMYDIWGIKEVPPGGKVVRVEFQLMRQAIKELGIDTPEDLFRLSPNLWAYCTQSWLKFQDRPGTHHTQRTLLPWWEVVQNGYAGAQDAHPLIRFKAVQSKQKQLIQQAYGLLSSLTALQQEQNGQDIAEAADFNDCLSALFNSFGLMNNPTDFSVRVFQKRAMNNRMYDKQAFVQQLREELGFYAADQDDQGGDNAKH